MSSRRFEIESFRECFTEAEVIMLDLSSYQEQDWDIAENELISVHEMQHLEIPRSQ